MTNMTIGSYKDAEGRICYTLELDYASTEAFKQGKLIEKRSADSQGHFMVVAQLKRPRRKADRFKGL